MSESKPLVNRVKKSGLITFDLEEFMPEEEVDTLDIKDFLFKGLLLKEKEFRTAVKEHNWEQYKDKVLCVECSTDAIVPNWAYMLITKYASPYTIDVFNGSEEEWLKLKFRGALNSKSWEEYEDAKLVVKGCGDKNIPSDAYLHLVNCLMPYASSIMFGEACSAVPVFKNRK